MRGKFVYKIMKNEANGYCVFRYHFHELNQDITCIGTNLPMNNINYDFEVEEIDNPKYGRQFKVLSYTESIGKDKNELIEYMCATYDGIGKKTAERIYNKFGESCLDIIEKEPDKLLVISRLTKNQLDKIICSARKKQLYKDLYILLLKHDFSSKMIEKITHIYKERAYELVKDNPYILCDIKGIDFAKADQLRKECNVDSFDSRRIQAAAIQSLKNDMLAGNVGTTKEVIIRSGYKLLALNTPTDQAYRVIWREVIQMVHTNQISYHKVFYNNNVVQYLYMNHMHEAEMGFAKMIVMLMSQNCEPVKGLDELILKYEIKHNITLDDTQRQSVIMSFSNQFMLLIGGPGTGKTTDINIICSIYEEIHGKGKIELLAPTGRAARRMSECSGRSASTIHSRLSLGISEQNTTYTEDDIEPIRDKLLIVDEFSMVDLLLGYKLLSHVEDCKVIFVGDANQLPSVNAGQLLADLIQCGCVPVALLKYSHRQAEGSTICLNANGMQEGIYDLQEAEDFQIVYSDEAQPQSRAIMDKLQKIEDQMVEDYVSLRNDPDIASIACLCPYKQYPAGVYSVNKRIQNIVNPLNSRDEMKGFSEMVFREGDLVMHLRNEDDTMNGDLGIVRRIYSDPDRGMVMDVEYDTYIGIVHMEYTNANIEDVTLAYAMTVHKSQGSEYDAVITCLTGFHKPMLYLNVLYTAITRGKKRVKLYADNQETIKKVVQNKHAKQRNSLLAYNIRLLCEQNVQQLAFNLAQ